MIFQGWLKQSTAITVVILMVDAADHITGKTGLSAGLTFYQSKAGAATGAIVPTSVTELDATNAKGLYAVALNTTTWTNTTGDMVLHITGTGADPADYKWIVTARLPDDLAFPATSGRSMVVDGSGLVDATSVKVGPTGAGTAQTAKDLGASATQTGDNFARLGAPAGASVSADVASLQTDTTNIKSRIPAALTGAGNIKADVQVNSDKTGYAIAIGGIINGANAAAELNNIADGTLDRIISVGTDSGADDTTHRTVRQCLRILRNKVGIAAGTVTVTKEDDVTTSWTGGVTTSAGNPISQIDPT